MMKKKSQQKGFSKIKVLLVITIVSGLGFLAWYFYSQRNNSSNSLTKNLASGNSLIQDGDVINNYERTTTVPKGWQQYYNDKYNISFSFPKDWQFKVDDIDSALVGWFYPNSDRNPQHQLYTLNQTLEEALSARKKLASDSSNSESGIKVEIVKEEQFLFDGLAMVKLDLKTDDGTAPDTHTTEIYIAAYNRLYVFDVGFNDTNQFANHTVLNIFESIKIK